VLPRSAIKSPAIKRSTIKRAAIIILTVTFILSGGFVVAAQEAPAASAPPILTLTLQDALARARANSIPFQAALTDQGLAREDKKQAGAALLPSVTYNNEFVYTQGNGTPSGRFVASNGVREYLSQGNVHQVLGVSGVSDYRRARALEAVARAKAEIAARGLVVTVVQGYYGLLAAQRKYATTQLAVKEAEQFLSLSRKLENGGEVAHADVIKAQIQHKDRQRDLLEARLAMDKGRLDLAVLLFPDFNENFTVVDDANLAPSLASFEDFIQAAQTRNPDLRAANAGLRAARFELASARGAYFPTLALDYFYGIDAPHFAVHEPDGTRNLGYATAVTLNIPVWNWGATHSKVVQAGLKRKQAARELSFAQRKLQAEIRELYADADAARSELELLKSSSELAAESLRLTTLRYQGGEATVLEVVDAQNTLTQTRNAYDDAGVRYRVTLANLQSLTGTM
jgi:outer membrane protein TolC